MARKTRIFLDGYAQHILLQSLDAITLFQEKSDYDAFMAFAKEYSLKYGLEIHAYLLLADSFEFVATPKSADALSKFMQSLGRQYVGYYNKKYERAGTLWEGRYKASLVEDSEYLLDLICFLEKKTPSGHLYSSLGKNLYNKKDELVSYHTLYKELGYTDEQRLSAYAEHFSKERDLKQELFFQECLQKQLVTGTKKFTQSLEEIFGTQITSKNRGRPKKQSNEQRKKMYKNLVVLDKIKHKDLKISSLENLLFAKSSTHIPLTAMEAAQVAKNFPIVFTADAKPSLIALVSLGGDNLALNSEGKWTASYVPSFLRRYPFSLASSQENAEQKVILIDEDATIFSKTKGQQLFKKNGDKSDVLNHAIEFLTSHQQQAQITENVIGVISQSGILETREISVGEGEEKKVLVNGFLVVNREKLNALSDDVLADWTRKGIIGLIEAHLHSLENIQQLFVLMQQRQS